MDEQYHSKFKMVQTQTLNQKNNFLLFFSLLSIIYLTFSLSSHISVSLPSTSTFLSTILSPLSLSQPLSLSLPLSQAVNLHTQPISPWFLLCLKQLISPWFLLLSICFLTLISLPLKFGRRKRKATKYNVVIINLYGLIFFKIVEMTCDRC